MYELMVSVLQGLFKADEGNWLVTCKKSKSECASYRVWVTNIRARIVSR